MEYTFDLDDFAARHLGGDVERLAELSLGTIQAQPQVYGTSVLGGDDCDDTNLAWEVYHRLWGVERFRKSLAASPDATAGTGGSDPSEYASLYMLDGGEGARQF